MRKKTEEGDKEDKEDEGGEVEDKDEEEEDDEGEEDEKEEEEEEDLRRRSGAYHYRQSHFLLKAEIHCIYACYSFYTLMHIENFIFWR